MSMGWESQIIRVSTGKLNTVNDTVIANQSGITGVSKFGGQLGKVLYLAQDQISTMFDSSVGTLFGGAYRYVHLSEELSTPEPAIGQFLFWDDNPLDPGSYIVTDTGPTDVPQPAGVYVGGIEAGNYGFIQIAGLCYVLFGSLSNAGALGQGIIVTAAGLADNGTPVNPTYVGWMAGAAIPVHNQLGLVELNSSAFRG